MKKRSAPRIDKKRGKTSKRKAARASLGSGGGRKKRETRALDQWERKKGKGNPGLGGGVKGSGHRRESGGQSRGEGKRPSPPKRIDHHRLFT